MASLNTKPLRRKWVAAATLLGFLAYLLQKDMLQIQPMTVKCASTSTQQQPHQHTPIAASAAATTALVFDHDPERFVRLFVGCVVDPSCRVFYHHVQKTGGSFLASRLFPVLDQNHKRYDSKKWCCDQVMMKRFWNATSSYCNRKLGVYEVTGGQFHQVVTTCSSKSASGGRAVALITFREPIQRTQSMIHHQCNKNYDRKDPIEQETCRKCHYSANRTYWNQYVIDTTKTYLDIAQMMVQLQSAAVDVLSLDNPNIDRFFSMLEHNLNTTMPSGRGNGERTGRCSFGMTSPMVKGLGLATAIYKNLTLGRY